jgi:hypothetical protein
VIRSPHCVSLLRLWVPCRACSALIKLGWGKAEATGLRAILSRVMQRDLFSSLELIPNLGPTHNY